MALSVHTGWTLTELMELTGEELMQWCEVLPEFLPQPSETTSV